MYQLPDWESGRFSSKDELLVVILQNFFPFVDLKNYMQPQVLQARRGGAKSARLCRGLRSCAVLVRVFVPDSRVIFDLVPRPLPDWIMNMADCYCELTAHADAKEISKEGKPHVHFPCEKCNGRTTKNIKNVIEYLLSCARSDFPINCHQK